MSRAFLRSKRSFASDNQGSITVLFAFMVVVLTFAAGVAIDYSRIVHTNSKITAAADAATLAAGRALLDGRNTDADIQQLALTFFNENMTASGMGFGDVQNITVTVDRPNGKVQFNVDVDIPMTLTRVLGHDKTDAAITSTAVFDQSDIELGMALDVTGSMGGSKLASLKVAAKDLIEILLPDGGTTNSVKIGIAPYAPTVNAGTYAAAVSNGTSIDGCVWGRSGSQAFTDAAPGPGTYLSAGAPATDIDPTQGTSPYSCPSATVMPLSDDKATLKTTIDSFVAGGYTAGHLGAAWAGYLVSPKWASIWPSASEPVAYDDDDTQKVVILMTDGIFNTAYLNGTSSYQAVEICDSIKDNDVVVYSIAFQAPSSAQATLQACASTSLHYFNASSGTELNAAFVAIAKQLNNLRLSN